MKRQRGAALLALAAIVVLGVSWMIVTALGNASQRTNANREHNARVLSEAKAALVGWVAANSLNDNNPGRLPCPEAANNVGTAVEGVSAPWIGPPATPTCSLVGRLPWRTLGLSKLRDSTGEPLWYVVSPGWALNISSTLLSINSNSRGQLMVDGLAAPNEIVALVIAPGQAMNVQAAAGCMPRAQARATPSPALDARDYIECFDASASPPPFFTLGPGGSFNDQVLKVTTADILPVLEAAIARRIERDIVLVLRDTAYSGMKWNAAAANTVYQFATPFSDPGASNFQGAAGTYQGLLPLSYLPPCSPVGDARCTASTYHSWGTPSLLKVSGSGSLSGSPSCSVSGSLITCTGYYQSSSLQASFDDPVSNVANALRDFNLANHTATVWTNLYDSGCDCWDGYQIETSTRSRRFNSGGSLSFVVLTPFRWTSGKEWGYYYIEAQRPVFSNHQFLTDILTVPSLSWFMRNEWHRLTYYAIAPSYAAGGALSCVDPTTCLQANVGPAGKRALLVLAGRSLTGVPRPIPNPAWNLADYLEGANADLNTTFEQRSVNASFNDRVVVVDTNP